MTTTIDTQSDVRPSLRMSEEEFVQWAGKDVSAEWVAGKVELKMPVTCDHDELQHWLRNLLQFFVERRQLGRVKGPEYPMRLSSRPSRREPDVMFVTKERVDLMGRTHLNGPADLAIEIVSLESIARDYRDKLREYETAGVSEYWIVNPLNQTVDAHALTPAGKYEPIEPKADGTIHSVLLPGLWIRPAELFGETLPDVIERVKQLTA